MTVARSEYLDELRKQVSRREREDLENAAAGPISDFNRLTLLRMLRRGEAPEGGVDAEQAEELRLALAAYLERYMPDCPQGHKWIILSCLYLAMVEREPMHPQSATGWRKSGEAYFCPAREDTEGSICRWCVCRSAEDAAIDRKQ